MIDDRPVLGNPAVPNGCAWSAIRLRGVGEMKGVLCLAAVAAGLIGLPVAHRSGPSAKGVQKPGMASAHRIHASSVPGGSGQLVYHGGPVMHTNTTYAIYWVPPGYSM